MIHVIAILTTAPGKRDEVLSEFRKIVPVVHQEAGCIEYQPVVDIDDANAVQNALGADTFMVIEKWESAAHLQAHSVASHMQAYGQKVGSLIANRQIHVLDNA